MSAIAVVGFTWKSITQVNSEQALAREEQITERYTAAVENLGNKGSEDVRLGGVYALQRLMKDSPRDQATVIDVLSSFLRSHSKKPKPGDGKTRLNSDVTAALTVLTSRDSRNDGTTRVDLFEADLPRAKLAGGDLSNANLDRTDLHNANLRGALLYDATLGGADLAPRGVTARWRAPDGATAHGPGAAGLTATRRAGASPYPSARPYSTPGRPARTSNPPRSSCANWWANAARAGEPHHRPKLTHGRTRAVGGHVLPTTSRIRRRRAVSQITSPSPMYAPGPDTAAPPGPSANGLVHPTSAVTGSRPSDYSGALCRCGPKPLWKLAATVLE
ncbi:pentapeptide repeat-containing protein [Streptomyces sp. ISL-43]|uniref:pentapeptide repeat-containing protein n=1 Tax=Streptomyces sp. ISL-43 TaxID=2819183 RepID=UPI001BEB08FC|nr:pentapeptide repeat-containing protein [Streptomyces sp. ISL-43]MBT2446223.1 pentapeptide repeat-containing protein [Streptomyces sp. ISL-43]